jgi:hypothetical protein
MTLEELYVTLNVYVVDIGIIRGEPIYNQDQYS